jgi:glucosamine-6-phosphate deaminase
VAELRVFADAGELGHALAAEIVDAYAAADGRPFLLGCPGGRSLLTTYRALAEGGADFSRLVVVMMDEYIGASNCALFVLRELGEPLSLRDDQIWMPSADDPDAYDRRIAAQGGIDLFLLGSGASDGHVAFLPPGSPRDGRTSVVALAETTRHDNLATFPDFESIDDVPTHGVSVGLGTIGDARSLRLVLQGAGKRTAAARLLELDAFDPDWPASIVHDHADAEIWLDRAALR